MKKYNIFLILALTLLLVACGGTESTSRASIQLPEESSSEKSKPIVEGIAVSKKAFEGTVQLTGYLIPNKQVTLHAMEGGFVRSMKYDIGDKVRKGSTLAYLNNPSLKQMKHEAEVSVASKKKVYDRYKKIFDATPELTNIFEMEKMEAEFQAAEAQLQTITDRIKYLAVTSPLSGVITKRYIDPGASVQSGLSQSHASPLYDIMELTTVRLVIEVPESEIARIKKGTELKVNFPELGNREMQAKVSRMAYALHPQNKSMRVEVDIPNAKLELKPGMYAKVSLKTSSEFGICVPIMALVSEKGQQFVYKVVGSHVEKTEVKLGLEDRFDVEITSGLTADDQVVVSGKELISDGLEVTVIEK